MNLLLCLSFIIETKININDFTRLQRQYVSNAISDVGIKCSSTLNNKQNSMH